MTYDAGDYPVARRRLPVPIAPRRYEVRVGGRVVASLALQTGGDIVPGSVAWHADPASIGGPDRERAVAHLVRLAGLDPKSDHDRVYDAVFPRTG